MRRKKNPSRAKQPLFIPVVLIVIIGIIGLAFITPIGAKILQPILSNAGVLLATVIGGVIVLYIEYNFFQAKKRSSNKKTGKTSSRQTTFNKILGWFGFKTRAGSSKIVSIYNWDNARRIALQSFKDKLDKFQWTNEEANIVSISTDGGRSTINVVITSKTFATPVPIERYRLVINKTGDIIEMNQIPL